VKFGDAKPQNREKAPLVAPSARTPRIGDAKPQNHKKEPFLARSAREKGLFSRSSFAVLRFRVSLVLAVGASTAHAGGIERPNGISARGTGMGGAWTAFADDASAVFFNPAALDQADAQVDVGGELVVGPRSYTPVADDGSRGPQQTATAIAPVPSLGVVGRFHSEGEPSRLSLGAGIFNTFGGQISFPKTGAPAYDSTKDVVEEADAGAALRVSDKLALGAALRLGLGLFGIGETMNPIDAHVSASGVGMAVGLGALVRPTPDVTIGLAWRSTLRIATQGTGTVTFSSGPIPQQVSHDQVWPQQASLGLGWRAAPRVRLAAQADWTQWSQVKDLGVDFPATPTLNQAVREDWRDSWTARVGGEYRFSNVAVRTGAYVDTNAVPDRTVDREYFDSTKLGVAAGASMLVQGWRIDGAVDWVLPGTRTVPNNDAQTVAFPADRNKAPGVYQGTLVTIELAVGHVF
jgi:long-chain fatty acid transport protein